MATYTKKLLNEFDRLTLRLSSPVGTERIMARFDVKAFTEKHGKEVCDAMFAELKEKDEANQ